MSSCIKMASERSCRTAARGRPCVLCTDFPSDFTVPGIVDLHHKGFREVILNGCEKKILNAVHNCL